MTEDSSAEDLIDRITAEFLERKQRGEVPTIGEYCQRFPEQSTELRELLQTIELVDNIPAEPASTSEAAQIDDEPIPAKVGPFTIVDEIGRGGMGVVLKATSEDGHVIALKILPKSLSDDARSVTRFRREAESIGRLQHEHIVALHDAGEADGHFYLAMQLVEGKNLATQIGKSQTAIRMFSDRRFRYRNIAAAGAQIASALGYAHAHGIIHRDVKPSNLLLDENGKVWLTDFGLAKTDDVALTRTGDVVGTLRYMAPERFRGDSDARVDVYSLGLTLYELVTGRPAFQTSSRLELVDLICNAEPDSLRSIDSSIPRDLERIILRAIEKEPLDRYPSAEELSRDLLRFSTNHRVTSVGDTFFKRWLRRMGLGRR